MCIRDRPYTEALVSSIPKLDNPSHTRLEIITGRPPDLVNPPAGCNFAPRCKYVQDKCRVEEPPLAAAETPGHLYRCWFPVGSPEGTAALERNVAAIANGNAPAPAAAGEATPTSTAAAAVKEN